MEELVELQRIRSIVLKRSDKEGGWVLTYFDVYLAEGARKLREMYLNEVGEEKPKYKEVTEQVLKELHKQLKRMAVLGVEKGYIGVEDGQNMVPKEPAAARL